MKSKYKHLRERHKQAARLVNAMMTMESRLNYAKDQAERTHPFPHHTHHYKHLVEIREMALSRLENIYKRLITNE